LFSIPARGIRDAGADAKRLVAGKPTIRHVISKNPIRDLIGHWRISVVRSPGSSQKFVTSRERVGGRVVGALGRGISMTRFFYGLLAGTASLCLLSGGASAQTAPAPQTPANADTTPEIVVTAQKRSESINRVGMAITAETGDQLLQQGIRSTADLAKVVPGFTYEGSGGNQPVYSIRGVGFHDGSLAAGQAVAIYADEVPIPFALETVGADYDIARVEVLKGPQGTLFGENSTGGAVNYIAAKPTNTMQEGLDVSFGRFSTSDITGFVSGPITSTLRGRIAIHSVQGDGWQTNYAPETTADGGASRTLGRTNRLAGRILLDWTPIDALKVSLNVNLRRDRSDTQAAQLVRDDPSSSSNPLLPAIVAFPAAPANDRAASWDPGVDYAQNNRWKEANLRIEYSLGATTLTSISAYQKYNRDAPAQDIDGTPYEDLQFGYLGSAETYYQELRASGQIAAKGHWIVGANYEHDNTYDQATYVNPVATSRILFGLPNPGSVSKSTNSISTTGVYGNADYSVLPNLSLQGGIRYTNSDRKDAGCSADRGDGTFSAIFETIQAGLAYVGVKTSPIATIPNGGCVTLDSTYTPGLVSGSLNENNLSWRVGANWTAAPDTLIYANISRGYKAGSFPLVAAASYVQYTPVKQESLLAYEAGFKTKALNRTLQLNASAFYYDYKDKQINGTYIDPVFGALTKLVTVPKSRVFGFEASADWHPLRGFTLTPAVTYVNTKILGSFLAYTPTGVLQDIGSEPFPYAPKWQAVGSAQYRWAVSSGLAAFVGGNVSYQSDTNAQFGLLPYYDVKGHTLVDLRAGVETADGRYRFSVWGNNVFNTYYWTSAQRGFDFDTRDAGMPVTYGATLSARFR